MSLLLNGSAVTVIDDGAYNAFPGLARFPNGSLIVVYRSGVTHVSPDGVIKQQISTNDGATWGAATTIVAPTGGNEARDPKITLLANGTFFLNYFEVATGDTGFDKVNGLIGTITGSTISWSSPFLVSDDAFTVSAINHCLCSGSALQLANGDILQPVYGFNHLTSSSTGILRSTDNGATWGSFVMVADDAADVVSYSELNLIQCANGDVLAISRNETLKGYSRSISTDDGATWSAVANVIDIGANSSGQPALFLLPSGDIFLFTRGPGYRAAYALSADDGATWSAWTNYGSTQEFVYASMASLGGANIDTVVAYDNHSVGAHIVYQQFSEASFEIITLVANTAAGSVAGAAITTSAIDTTGADFLIASMSDYSPASSTLTDSKGNTWLPLTAQISTSLASRTRLYYSANPVVGSGHTFTATPVTTSYPTINIAAFSGVRLVTPFDVQNGAAHNDTGGGGATALASGSVTPSEDSELVVTAIGHGPGTGHAINSSFTITDSVAFDNLDHLGGSMAYKVQTALAAVNPIWSWTTADFAAVVIASFKAALASPTQVATPAISPNGGTFTVATAVTLACATSGADIYYTTDGSTPDATDTLYTAPFTLSANATVKAIGIKSGLTDSAVRSAAFTITLTVATPSISPNGGGFLLSVDVTLACATAVASIYYTTDGSTPDATDTLYSVPFTLSVDTTVKAIGIKAGLANSVVASAAFTIVAEAPSSDVRQIRLSDVVGNLGYQSFTYIQPTDPALDAGVTLAAKQTWLDTSTDPARVKFRPIANNQWARL